MFVVDTNLLIYAFNEDVPEHEQCRALLDGWRRECLSWYTTWSILNEFLRAATHRRGMRKPATLAEGWEFVESLLASPGLGILVPTERHAAVAGQTYREVPFVRGNLVHDAHIAILMREHGIRTIYTRDMDFHRFPFLEVVDPLGADYGSEGEPGGLAVREPRRRVRRSRGRGAASRPASRPRRSPSASSRSRKG